MRRRWILALAVAYAGGFPNFALTQTIGNIRTKVGGIAGTGIGGGKKGIKSSQIPLAIGGQHIGSGTNGTGQGLGNGTGGINAIPRAGSGGIGDAASWGSLTGGVMGSGRAIHAGTGGINNTQDFGQNTGGMEGSSIGSGVGGRQDLNSLGAGTGGIAEQTAPRFTPAR